MEDQLERFRRFQAIKGFAHALSFIGAKLEETGATIADVSALMRAFFQGGNFSKDKRIVEEATAGLPRIVLIKSESQEEKTDDEVFKKCLIDIKKPSILR